MDRDAFIKALVAELKAQEVTPREPEAKEVYCQLCFDDPVVRLPDVQALATALAQAVGTSTSRNRGHAEWPDWFVLTNKFIDGVVHLASTAEAPSSATRGEGASTLTPARASTESMAGALSRLCSVVFGRVPLALLR